MIIEFVGPSGAGKTFIARQLKSYLQGNLEKARYIYLVDNELDSHYNSSWERLLVTQKYRFQLFLDKNFLSLLFIRMKAKGKKLFSLKYILRMFVWYCRMADILTNCKGNSPVFIMDEGFLARCGHMFKNRLNEVLSDYQELMGKINGIKRIAYAEHRKIYVLVKCEDYDEIINRVLARGKTSLYLRLDGDGRVFHEQELKSFELARDYLDRIKADYVVIDNNAKQRYYTAQFNKVRELIEKRSNCDLSNERAIL